MFYNLTKALGENNNQYFDISIKIIQEMLKKTAVYDFATVQFLF